MTSLPQPNQAFAPRFGPIHLTYNDEMAGWPMSHVDSLAVLLGGSADSFTGQLLALMMKADPGNRHRLASAFPWHHVALAVWENLSSPTYGGMFQVLSSLTQLGEVTACQPDQNPLQPSESQPG